MLNDKDLEKIGLYVKSHFSEWAKESNIIPFPPRERSDREIDLLERMVRVEEGLKSLAENMDRRFEAMNTRFEAIDKRFEDQSTTMNQRFNQMSAYFTTGFLVLGVLISVYQFLG